MGADRIVKAVSGFYYVACADGILECKARGKLRREDTVPLVGDYVTVSRQGNKGVLEAVLPRVNCFVRPAVANIDLLVVLASRAIPETEPFLIDRVLAVAERQGVPALICVNKDDLEPAEPLAGIYRRAGYPVIVTSAVTGEGIEYLRNAIKGKLAVFTGNSGVGKSSLLNCLCPTLSLAVGEVSQKLGRGRHTTRHVELYPLDETTFVADTPGFSAFDTERMELVRKEELSSVFPDFSPYLDRCQFRDCAHRKEPGCAVRQAVEAGKIEKSRYDSYIRLYEMAMELKEWEMP